MSRLLAIVLAAWIGLFLTYAAVAFVARQLVALDCHDHGNERVSALSSTSSYCSDTYYKGKST